MERFSFFNPTQGKEAMASSSPFIRLSEACAAYYFDRQTWKTLPSLSFIRENENKEVHCCGSAAGLLLVRTTLGERYKLCNPLTRKAFQLPIVNSVTRIVVIGIVNDGMKCKVVVVGPDGNGCHIVEIYDTREKKWKIARILPEDWRATGGQLAFSKQDGFPYFIQNTQIDQGVIGFSLRDRTSILVPFPDPGIEPAELVHFSYSFICDSWVLLLSAILQQTLANAGINHGLQGLILWELEKKNGTSSSSCWKEVARLPTSLLDEFNRFVDLYRSFGWGDMTTNITSLFELVGVGHHICIKSLDASHISHMRSILVYNIRENHWSGLICRIPIIAEGVYLASTFRPRLDMNVE